VFELRTGSDLKSLINQYNFNKKKLAELMGVSSMTIWRWIDSPEKEIQAKYAEAIRSIVFQIDEIKKKSTELSYKKIIERMLIEKTMGEAHHASWVSSEEFLLAMLKKTPELICEGLTILNDLKLSSQLKVDLLGTVGDALVVCEVKATAVTNERSILQLLGSIERAKKTISGNTVVKGIIIAPEFSFNIKSIAKNFESIHLKKIEITLNDET